MNRSLYFFVPVLLILIIAVSEMATAIYTPSLGLVAEFFGVSQAIVQWTVSINLLGLAMSGPFYGPLSDCFGRRNVLRIGMVLFLLGSLASTFAMSINVLLMARFVQGLGAGVAVVVAFAVVRDLFDEQSSARVLSFMGMAIALSPALHPFWEAILPTALVGACALLLSVLQQCWWFFAFLFSCQKRCRPTREHHSRGDM
jgi:DHA1 family bicyclomycin/chloramphenicol resistance-like MFS transporter